MTGPARTDEPRRTRTAIIELLGASPGGMTTAELARALGIHPNGVRKQLQALLRDGSVGAEREVSGRRGRPAVR
jgi:predicted ArsR family transcriptional regulator